MSTLPASLNSVTVGDRANLQSDFVQKLPAAAAPRIKVLFFTPSLGNGGAEMHLLRIMNVLERKEFSISVAVAQSGGSYEAALAEDVTVYALTPAGIRSSTIRILRAIKPLHQLIQTHQPDIVCSFQAHANLAAIIACRGVLPRPKLLVCAQNSPFAQYHRNWHPLDRLMRLLMAKLYPQANRMIALSHGVAAELRSLVSSAQPYQPVPIDIIYNAGVDDAVLQGAKIATSLLDRTSQNPVLIACGRLHPQKGYVYLLEAFAKVRQSIPARLLILGEGPLRASIEQHVKLLGLTDAVQLLGFQANPYLYMAAADLFVLSSLYEGFGNVIVEAMACGVPVVATDCPHGPAEILGQGKNGLLARPADANDLARQILKLLQNPKLQEKFARRGLERSQAFHASKIAHDYAEAFRRALLPAFASVES
ncbi:MAG: glycosyltransferase [Leptolyngbyaceae cyanobacterium]